MKALRLILLALACSAPLLAAAQWQWLDKDGRKVFSDRAPPPDVPANRIQKQPGVRGMPTTSTIDAAPVAANTPAAADAAAKPSGKDKELEAKRKQAEMADADKKRAEEAKLAEARVENCARAKQAQADLNSGIRMKRTNAKGEPEVMDDAARAAELRNVEAVIVRDCGGTTASARSTAGQPAP